MGESGGKLYTCLNGVAVALGDGSGGVLVVLMVGAVGNVRLHRKHIKRFSSFFSHSESNAKSHQRINSYKELLSATQNEITRLYLHIKS